MTKDLIKHNINFLEYPLWFQDDRLADNSKDGMIWSDREGYVYRAGYKPPVKTDAIFLLYLLLQSQLSNYSETLSLSRYQILQDCGFGLDSGWYNRLEDSLERWKMVGIKFSGTFYDGKEYKAINFGVIDSWEIRKDNKLLQIWFSPRFLEMMRGNGFFKYIKFSEFKQLRSSLATRLYEILSKSFHSSDTFNIETIKLAEKIPMKERYPAHIIPKIQAAIARINKNTTTQFGFTTRKSETERKKTILCFHKLVVMPKPAILIETINSTATAPQTNEMKSLIALLPLERQSQQTVLEIITGFYELYGAAYVSRNISYTNKYAKKNYRSYLLQALRMDYGRAMQEDEESKHMVTAQQSQKATESAIKEAEETHRRRLQEENQCQARAYINALNHETKVAMEHEAISGMAENIRNIVLKKAPGSRTVLNLAMEQIALRRITESKKHEQLSLPELATGSQF